MSAKEMNAVEPAAPAQDFETSMRQLEEIVVRLESGDLPLEDALQLFEQGVQISRYCQARLEAVERRVEILLKKDGGPLQPQPFQSAESD